MGETPIAQRLVEKTALAPLNPLPASGEGRQSVALAGVGFFGFNKQSSGHDISETIQLSDGQPIELPRQQW